MATLKSNIEKIKYSINLGAKEITDWAANTWAEKARAYTKVDTGNNREHIGVVRRTAFRAYVTPGDPRYWAFLNWGTANIPADFYFTRAQDETARELPSKAKEILNAHLK